MKQMISMISYLCHRSQAHPRVVGSRGNNKDDKNKFKSLEAACEDLKSRGFTDWDEFTKQSPDEKNKPPVKGEIFYAVAGCELLGVLKSWE